MRRGLKLDARAPRNTRSGERSEDSPMRRGLKLAFKSLLCMIVFTIRRFPDEEGTEMGRAS